MSMKRRLSRWLQHPLTAGMDVDNPRTTEFRRSIIRSKRFLSRLYGEWYDLIRGRLPAGDVSLRSLAPGWACGPCRAFERALVPVEQRAAMFALITLTRRAECPAPFSQQREKAST